MYRGLGVNEYGTEVSLHRCDSCGDDFSVCPGVPPDKTNEWDTCLSIACESYEPMRDAELYFGLDMVANY
jgi:hypothetical protein